MEEDVNLTQSINGFRGEYAWLSNMFLGAVTMFDGITYPSRENAFQAQKTFDIAARVKIAASSPADAKRIGRRVLLRSDWDDVRTSLMFEVLDRFFSQNITYKKKLIATGTKYIEETNTWGDRYWGVCNGVGENMLGKLLMELRDKYTNQER